jgi:glycosyltransferase involved in cell wall biosynthesis
MTKLSIIIPTRGRPTRLKQALESIYTTAPDVFEIIIVDDTDDKETLALVASEMDTHKNIFEIVTKDIREAPVKWNIGATASFGDALLLGEDDIIWHQGWYENTQALLSLGYGYIGCWNGYGTYPTNYIVTKKWARTYLGGVLSPPCYKSQPGDIEVWGIVNAKASEDSWCWANQEGTAMYVYVQNMHPYVAGPDGAPLAKWDPTYEQRKQDGIGDMDIFRDRQANGFPITWERVF